MKISSSIPSKNSIQERQSIIAQASARGLQLSEDGRSWVPINSESRNLPLNQNNVIIVKNEQLNNSQAATVTILYFIGIAAVILLSIIGFFIVANVVYFLFWIFTFQWLGGEPFTPLSFLEIFSFFG